MQVADMQVFLPDCSQWCSVHKRYHPLAAPCQACVDDVEDLAPHGDTVQESQRNADKAVLDFTVGSGGIRTGWFAYVCTHCWNVKNGGLGSTRCPTCAGAGLFFVDASEPFGTGYTVGDN